MKLYITALATTLVVFSGSVLAEVMNGNQSGAANTQGNGLAQGNNANNMGGFPNNWTPNSNNMSMPWNNSNGQGFSMPWGNGGNNNAQNYPMPMQMQTPQMPMTNYFSPQQVQELMMQQQAQFRKQQQAQYQAFLKQIAAMQAQSKQAIPTAAPKVVAPIAAPIPKTAPDVIAPATAPVVMPAPTITAPAVVPAPTATVVVPKAEEAPVPSK